MSRDVFGYNNLATGAQGCYWPLKRVAAERSTCTGQHQQQGIIWLQMPTAKVEELALKNL